MTNPELPNLVSIALGRMGLEHSKNAELIANVSYALFAAVLIASFSWVATRRLSMVPRSRAQNAVEILFGGLDDFVCGVLGHKGRDFTPFIGTLFIYILCMNLFGLVPLLKAPTASWSTTLALALCVFVYVQIVSFKELGLIGYIDHLLGRPRGFIAATVFIPLLMFMLHVVGELVKPISLSLRLRSNIWGDDMLLAVLVGFGLPGIPLILFNMALALLAIVIQSVVFCLLSTIYFVFVLAHDE